MLTLMPASAACRGSYAHQDTIELASLIPEAKARSKFSHVWGRENISLLSGKAPAGVTVVRVGFPRGSVNPGNPSYPSGGAGFLYRLKAGAERACLTYRVRFPQTFDFVRGGKLPGLFGGQAPRGCTARDLSIGFSARLMWRTAGVGELYLYSPDRSARCGDSIQAGAWTFPVGRWVTVQQEIELSPNEEHGDAVRIWIDEALVMEQAGLRLRDNREVAIAGLLFSTFFGGADASWASPTDQFADFIGFTIKWSPSSQQGARARP